MQALKRGSNANLANLYACVLENQMSKILKQCFLWFVVIVGASMLTCGAQRFTPLVHDSKDVSCCQQVGLVNPSLGLFYLAFTAEGYDSKRWRRDFVLELEKRRAKRHARLMAKTASQSLTPIALLWAGAR